MRVEKWMREIVMLNATGLGMKFPPFRRTSDIFDTYIKSICDTNVL